MFFLVETQWATRSNEAKKKRAAKVAMQLIGKMSSIANFEPVYMINIEKKVFDEACDFSCHLYSNVISSSLNVLWAHLFAFHKQDICSPLPTEDAFKLHVLRSLAQFSLYRQSSLCNPNLLPPENYGRRLENGAFIPLMKTLLAKPTTAKLQFCKYKATPYCQRICSWRKLPGRCIIACPCNGNPDKCGLRITYDDDADDDDQ